MSSEKIQLPTLLVITDNPSLHHWIHKHLNQQFFIIYAIHETTALEIVQTTALDFLILDSNFEESNPLELCHKLRQANLVVPILFVTGRLKKSYRDAALEAGATDFLSNQLDLEELETRIATGLHAAAMRSKTSELFSTIKHPRQEPSSTFFKQKFVMDEHVLRILGKAKKPIALLLIQFDPSRELPSEEKKTLLLQSCKQLLRSDDLLIPSMEGRFMMLLPHTTPLEAQKIAQHLQHRIQQDSVRFTVSIAVSAIEAEEALYQKILANATLALQQTSQTSSIISLEAP